MGWRFMKKFCKYTTKSPPASYIPLPRFLLLDEELRSISNDAKVLYALLLDGASISRQNGYIDHDGTIRLYFTVEQVQKKLHRSRQSATRIFRELEYYGDVQNASLSGRPKAKNTLQHKYKLPVLMSISEISICEP